MAGPSQACHVQALRADPFKNDQNFILSMLTLEELGATGNKGLIGIITNPVLANAVAGLATSATAQAAIERNLLWDRRTEIIEPFGETAQQVFARISMPPPLDLKHTHCFACFWLGRYTAGPASSA